MTTLPRILPVAPATLKTLDASGYDAALASLGFEYRCREIPAALGAVATRVALPFKDRQQESYEANAKFFADHEWEIPKLGIGDDESRWIVNWVEVTSSREEVHRVAVDVSSMSRSRIAAVIEGLMDLPAEVDVEIDLLYTPSVFVAPTPEDDPPVLGVGPVSGYFAGWWTDLEAPLHAIIGVGYELERASSAIDLLEPEEADVMLPVGTDVRYLQAVRKANTALFHTKHVSSPRDYPVGDPFACFHVLESNVHRLTQEKRVALVPLGPKIYAACALLVGALHPQRVQVIRVSARDQQRPVDHRSDGDVFGLRVVVRQPKSDTRRGTTQSLSEGDVAVD